MQAVPTEPSLIIRKSPRKVTMNAREADTPKDLQCTNVKTGPKKSLKGFRRIEVRITIKEFLMKEPKPSKP
jgi:hypothetical protein